jgi:predicted nucleic acid-binding protein
LTEVVLDASVVLKWFRSKAECHRPAALALRRRFEAGQLFVMAPPLLHLEVMNIAGRRWRWKQPALVKLAAALSELGFELKEAELNRVACWTAQGLTAYDAAYVALAEAASIPLVTDDGLIVEIAPQIAVPLAQAAPN